jgi:hypothetical protein
MVIKFFPKVKETSVTIHCNYLIASLSFLVCILKVEYLQKHKDRLNRRFKAFFSFQIKRTDAGE